MWDEDPKENSAYVVLETKGGYGLIWRIGYVEDITKDFEPMFKDKKIYNDFAEAWADAVYEDVNLYNSALGTVLMREDEVETKGDEESKS